MNHTVPLPSFRCTFGSLVSSSSERAVPLERNDQRPFYQGMSVQNIESPAPAYAHQAATGQNISYPSHLLSQYQTEPFTEESLAITPCEPYSCYWTDRLAYSRDYSRAYNWAYNRAYNRAYKIELDQSADPAKARQAAQAAGSTAGQAAKLRFAKSIRAGNSLTMMTQPEAHKSYKQVYNVAYKRAQRTELARSGDTDKARQIGRIAAKAAVKHLKLPRGKLPDNPLRRPYINAYGKAYGKAYRKAQKAELAQSGDSDKARKAAQAAGQAAGQAAVTHLRQTTGFARSQDTPSLSLSNPVDRLFYRLIEPVSFPE